MSYLKMAVNLKRPVVLPVTHQVQKEGHITDEGRRCLRDLQEVVQELLMKKHLLGNLNHKIVFSHNVSSKLHCRA